MSAEAVPRCALLKHRQLSCQELAFHVEVSAPFGAFARQPWGRSPRKSVLHKTISAIRPQTLEEINRVLLARRGLNRHPGIDLTRLEPTLNHPRPAPGQISETRIASAQP